MASNRLVMCRGPVIWSRNKMTFFVCIYNISMLTRIGSRTFVFCCIVLEEHVFSACLSQWRLWRRCFHTTQIRHSAVGRQCFVGSLSTRSLMAWKRSCERPLFARARQSTNKTGSKSHPSYTIRHLFACKQSSALHAKRTSSRPVTFLLRTP